MFFFFFCFFCSYLVFFPLLFFISEVTCYSIECQWQEAPGLRYIYSSALFFCFSFSRREAHSLAHPLSTYLRSMCTVGNNSPFQRKQHVYPYVYSYLRAVS